MSRRTVLRYLREPSPYWRVKDMRYLDGEEIKTKRVVFRVSVRRYYHYDSRTVRIPIEALSSLATFRSYMFAAISSYQDPAAYSSPRSRKSLRETCGVSNVTQLKYEKRAGVEKKTNLLDTQIKMTHDWHPAEEEAKQGYYTDNIDGEYVMVKRLPNSYRGGLQCIGRRSSLLYSADKLPEGQWRLFFDDYHAACKHRDQEVAYAHKELPRAKVWRNLPASVEELSRRFWKKRQEPGEC